MLQRLDEYTNKGAVESERCSRSRVADVPTLFASALAAHAVVLLGRSDLLSVSGIQFVKRRPFP